MGHFLCDEYSARNKLLNSTYVLDGTNYRYRDRLGTMFSLIGINRRTLDTVSSNSDKRNNALPVLEI